MSRKSPRSNQLKQNFEHNNEDPSTLNQQEQSNDQFKQSFDPINLNPPAFNSEDEQNTYQGYDQFKQNFESPKQDLSDLNLEQQTNFQNIQTQNVSLAPIDQITYSANFLQSLNFPIQALQITQSFISDQSWQNSNPNDCQLQLQNFQPPNQDLSNQQEQGDNRNLGQSNQNLQSRNLDASVLNQQSIFQSQDIFLQSFEPPNLDQSALNQSSERLNQRFDPPNFDPPAEQNSQSCNSFKHYFDGDPLAVNKQDNKSTYNAPQQLNDQITNSSNFLQSLNFPIQTYRITESLGNSNSSLLHQLAEMESGPIMKSIKEEEKQEEQKDQEIQNDEENLKEEEEGKAFSPRQIKVRENSHQESSQQHQQLRCLNKTNKIEQNLKCSSHRFVVE